MILSRFLTAESFYHEFERFVGHAITSLKAKTPGAVAVNHMEVTQLLVLQNLAFNPGPAISYRSKTYLMADHTKSLNSGSLRHQLGTDLDSALHDALGKGHIRRHVPALIRAASEGRSTAFTEL